MGINAVLSPLELECWIEAYRTDDLEYVEEKCIKPKPILLSFVLELIEKPIEYLFSDVERWISQDNISLLYPYINGPIDQKRYKYQLGLFTSSEGIGKRDCDTTFVRCIATENNNRITYYPIAMDVARSIEDAILGVSASEVRYPVPVPIDFLNKISSRFLHDSSLAYSKYWMDILFNPGGDMRITEKWLIDNRYIGVDPTFRLIGLEHR